MIEIKKRRILFGVLLDAGSYEKEDIIKMVAKKNNWDEQQAAEAVGAVFKVKEEEKKKSRGKK